MPAAAIQVEDLHHAYGAVPALNGVSFQVSQGECFGLLGPNGAGKTTTIQAIVGALRPDRGRVAILGEDDPTRPSVRSRIGVVPQSIALYQELTGEENLAFFGKLYGLNGARLKTRVDATLALAGLTDRAKDRASTYSGGMQRRLNLVCGLIHDPLLILMDEPTVGVDPQSRNLIFENIESLKAQGRTVLYTTHYMEEAERLCDRVAIVDHGKILALDRVSALLTLSPTPSPDLEAVFLHLTGTTLRDR